MNKVLISAAAAVVLLALLGVGIYVLTVDPDGSGNPVDPDASSTPDVVSSQSWSEPAAGSGADVAEAVPEGNLDVGEGEFTIRGLVVSESDDPLPHSEVTLLETSDELEALLAQPIFYGDEDDVGRRLAEASGRLRKRLGGRPRLVSSEDGSFSFDGLEAGSYRLLARIDGRSGAERLFPGASPIIELTPIRPRREVQLTLRAGSVIRGVVMSPQFEPIENARLLGRWKPDAADLLTYRDVVGADLLEIIASNDSQVTTSGPDGAFVLSGLLPGEYSLVAEAVAYARKVVRDVPPDGLELQVVLEPELAVRGEVVNEEGKAVPSAEIKMAFLSTDSGDFRSLFRYSFRSEGREDYNSRVLTDEDGLFAIRGLSKGTYRVEVARDGFQRSVEPFLYLNEDSSDEEKFLTYRLTDGRVIDGRVTDDQGKPVFGARVRARWERELPAEGEEPDRQEEGGDRRRGERRDRGGVRSIGSALERASVTQVRHEARTQVDGSFQLSSLAPAVYRLEVESRGFLRHTRRGVPTDGDSVEIELTRGRNMKGVVLDSETEQPVPLAVVRFYPQEAEEDDGEDEDERRGFGGRRSRRSFGGFGGDRRETKTVRTDREGQFVVDDLEAVDYELRVEASGYLREEFDPVTPGGDDLELSIQPAASISGAIRDEAGQAVAGVRVVLIREREEDDGESGRSGSGRSRGGRESGRSWRGGRGSRREYVARSTLTDENGEYRLRPDRLLTVRVMVRDDEYVTTQSGPIQIIEAATSFEGVDLVVQRTARVFGTVVGANGLPVGRASVEVRIRVEEEGAENEDPRERMRRRFESFREGAYARTDALGRFEASGLSDGLFELTVRAAGHIDSTSDAFTLALGEAKPMDVELREEQVITGTVYSRDGSLVSSAEVYTVTDTDTDFPWGGFTRRARTLTTALGTYRIGKLEPATFNLRAVAEGFASSYLENVSAPASQVDFILDPLVTLAGVAVGATTGMPVANFRLRLVADNEDRLASRERDQIGRWRTFDGPEGEFMIENLPPGAYSIQLDAPEYLPVPGLRLILSPGEELHTIAIPVPEGGLIAGDIVDAAAQPIVGAQIQALKQAIEEETGKTTYQTYRSSLSSVTGSRSGREAFLERFSRGRRGGEQPSPLTGRVTRSGRTTSQTDGTFIVRGLPDGVYKLRVTHDEFVGTEIGEFIVQAEAGGEAGPAGVRVDMKPGARVKGRVTSASGQSAVGALVRLSGGIERKDTRVDTTGRFEIRGLGPGTYDIRVRYLSQDPDERERGRPRGSREEQSTGPSVKVEITEKDKVKEVTVSLD